MTAIAECYLMSSENNSNINNILKWDTGQKIDMCYIIQMENNGLPYFKERCLWQMFSRN